MTSYCILNQEKTKVTAWRLQLLIGDMQVTDCVPREDIVPSPRKKMRLTISLS